MRCEVASGGHGLLRVAIGMRLHVHWRPVARQHRRRVFDAQYLGRFRGRLGRGCPCSDTLASEPLPAPAEVASRTFTGMRGTWSLLSTARQRELAHGCAEQAGGVVGRSLQPQGALKHANSDCTLEVPVSVLPDTVDALRAGCVGLPRDAGACCRRRFSLLRRCAPRRPICTCYTEQSNSHPTC